MRLLIGLIILLSSVSATLADTSLEDQLSQAKIQVGQLLVMQGNMELENRKLKAELKELEDKNGVKHENQPSGPSGDHSTGRPPE
jgi:regulator of replication initiation timing